MGLIKNQASQIAAVYANTKATDTPTTGDAANITAQISLDGAASAATNDVNPTELDATNHPGVYLFTLTQAETNADLVVLSAVSATSGVQLEPVFLYTQDQTIASIIAALSAGVVNVVSPVADDGTIDLILGDDFAAAQSRSITFTSTGWGDLTGATVTLYLYYGKTQVLSKVGTVVTPTGTAVVRFELTDADTAALRAADHKYVVRALMSDANINVLSRGPVTITTPPYS